MDRVNPFSPFDLRPEPAEPPAGMNTPAPGYELPLYFQRTLSNKAFATMGPTSHCVARPPHTHTHTHIHIHACARTSTYGFVKFLVSPLSLSLFFSFSLDQQASEGAKGRGERMTRVLNGSQFLIYPACSSTACMDVRVSRNGSRTRCRIFRGILLTVVRTNTRMHARNLEAESVSRESNFRNATDRIIKRA